MSEKKTWWQGPRGEWYVIVQVLIFIVVLFGPKSVPGLPRWPAPWDVVGAVAGIVVGGAGGILVLFGLVSLGSNLTAVPFPKDSAQMVEHGAYRLVRHPIYSGIIIGSLGYGLLWASTLGVLYAVLLFLFFDVKSRREEQWLRDRYPGYEAYTGRVHKLIPFLY
jgi:protein-S-isoprenylcysteine O-methyltransferase Ste14